MPTKPITTEVDCYVLSCYFVMMIRNNLSYVGYKKNLKKSNKNRKLYYRKISIRMSDSYFVSVLMVLSNWNEYGINQYCHRNIVNTAYCRKNVVIL